MRDYRREGIRVQTCRPIREYIILPENAKGTIVCDSDNGLGVEIVLVRWDQDHQITPIFPHELVECDCVNPGKGEVGSLSE